MNRAAAITALERRCRHLGWLLDEGRYTPASASFMKAEIAAIERAVMALRNEPGRDAQVSANQTGTLNPLREQPRARVHAHDDQSAEGVVKTRSVEGREGDG